MYCIELGQMSLTFLNGAITWRPFDDRTMIFARPADAQRYIDTLNHFYFGPVGCPLGPSNVRIVNAK